MSTNSSETSSSSNSVSDEPDKKADEENDCDGLYEYLIINYRWMFVCLFLLPLSLVYDVYFYMRNWFVFKLMSAPKRHDSRAREVQRQVRDWKDRGMVTTMCTARPGWQTMSLRVGKYKGTSHRIHVNLVDILEIDTDGRKVSVEPLVTMGQMTATLCPLGWTLPIVPELDDLTVGGMINGTGVESSSHLYGLFQHICLAYEVVLSDGSLVRCTEKENSDLFYSIPLSHGTIGFVVSADLRIIPCKPYVRLEFFPFHSASRLCHALERASKGRAWTNDDETMADFVECLMFSNDAGVLMLGRMTDLVQPNKVNRIGRFYKPWFYTHVEKYLSGRDLDSNVEYIPLRDYYHRHTKSLFWEMRDIVPFGNRALFRFLLGWSMPPKVSFLKLTQGETIRRLYEKHQFIQDLLIPINKLQEFLSFCDETVKIYPIWLCPFQLFKRPGMVYPKTNESMYVDVGLYGMPQVKHYQARETTRKVEACVRQINGYQMLYADTYMSEGEFREMYDRTMYDKVRRKLDCGKAFSDVYHKISKEARH